MSQDALTTAHKALAFNLDPTTYGSFAEIGAGQEVVRHFFQAGGAAGTVALSRSAYDMRFSDTIYGKEEKSRYVCESRVCHMLETEHEFLKNTLWETKPDNTFFFAFANTVATRSFSRPNIEAHGWLGIRFQRKNTHEAPSQILLHVRLLELDYKMQQEAIGIAGVNLIYAALNFLDDPTRLIESLIDNLTLQRIEVDTIKCTGPACAQLDNQLLNFKLVTSGLTHAVIFDSRGEVQLPGELMYKRPVLVQPGSFRPITHVNMDMQTSALRQFMQEPQVQGQDPLVLMEITLSNLASDGNIDERDFLNRIDLVTSLGNSVLISNFALHYQFANYIARNSKSFFAFVLGVANVRETMKAEYYENLDGGILEAFGKLFAFGGKLYVYPQMDQATSTLLTSANLPIAANLKHLYYYLVDNQLIHDIENCAVEYMNIYSKDVLKMIQSGKSGWEKCVPEKVVEIIKQKRLWCEDQKRKIA